MSYLRRFTLGFGLAALATGGLVSVLDCVGDEPAEVPVRDAGGSQSDATPPPEKDGSTDDGATPDSGRFTLKTPGGLVLWLNVDVEASLGLEDGGAGTSRRVAAWRDQSAAHNDFIQLGPSAWPVYVALPNDGGYAVSCNTGALNGYGGSMSNDTDLGIADGAERTFLVVARWEGQAGRQPLFVQNDPLTSPSYPNALFSIEANPDPNNKYGLVMMGANFDYSHSPSTAAYSLHELRMQTLHVGEKISPNIEYRINGILQMPLGNFDNVFGDRVDSLPHQTETTLCRLVQTESDANTVRSTGTWSIQEVAVYNRRLSDADLAKVEADINARRNLF